MSKKPKCRQCKKEFERVYTSVQVVCSSRCAIEFAKTKATTKEARENIKAKKEARRQLRARKVVLKKRSECYDDLQYWVNRYVRLRDRDEPCCTCGTTNPNIMYDAGHFRTRGGSPATRFYLMNIHKQCAISCNKYGSGMRREYEQFLIAKYGQTKVDWLNGPHPNLKEQYPTIDSIKVEIKRFKSLCKELEREVGAG